MANTEISSNILNELGKMAIFKMSLGSKELFHSNFMEFLFDIDHSKFISIINFLLPEGKKLPYGVAYEFRREDKNFDICLCHQEGQHIVYDLVIENKVKSIPHIDQLEGYEKKAEEKSRNNKKPILLLLSLAKDFPYKDKICYRWNVMAYDELHKAIKKYYCNLDGKNQQYVDDYLAFIEKMDKLQGFMVDDFNNQTYYNKDELKKYEEKRIHDLYIKLRGSLFVAKLKDRLAKKYKVDENSMHIMPFSYENRSFKYADIRPYCKEKEGIHIFLDYAIQQGSDMVAAYIYKHRKDRKCDYIYEIAIQSEQYRHGINSHNESDLNPEKLKKGTNLEGAKKLDKLWTAVYGYDNEWFDCIYNKGKTLPAGKDKHNKYAPEFVYKYVKIGNETVDTLLEAMANDIKYVIAKLDKE